MKKFIASILAAAAVHAAVFAADAAPSAVLSDVSKYAQADLFENEAVFMDPQANIDAVKRYESNPSAYSDDQLFPVAICYMTLRNPEKSRELLERFMKARPDNSYALRTYATLLLLSGDRENAFKNYEKSYAMGDKETAKLIASACILTGNTEGMEKYVQDLKEFAKKDLAALNMLLIYAYRKPDAKDLELAREVISSVDPRSALSSGNPDSFATAFNLYFANKSVWTPAALVIPARGAVLGGQWGMARRMYEEILKADPESVIALRGKAIVEFKLGGIMEAAGLIASALEKGDKAALNDAMELSILSRDKAVYEKFKKDFEGFDFTPQVRLSMLGYSVTQADAPDIFFAAVEGPGSGVLVADPRIREMIRAGLSKYEKDPRAVPAKNRVESAQAASK